MKRKLLLLSSFLCAFAVNAQIVNIPDTNFKNKLLQPAGSGIAVDAAGNPMVVDVNNDGEIQQSEAENVYMIELLANGISSLEGITSFTNLQKLTCAQNNVSQIDLSGLANLKEVKLYLDPYLNSLNFGGLTSLEVLRLWNLNVTSLDLSQCPALSVVDIQWCPVGNLDLYANTNLEELMLYQIGMSAIDLSTLSNLTSLGIAGNQITTLDLSNNLQLTELYCWNNDLTSIIVPADNVLEAIDFSLNNIASFDFSLCPNLTSVSCGANLLTSIDISDLALLESFSCQHNPIDTLDFSNNPLLTSVDVSYTNITELDLRYQQVTELNLNVCTALETLLIHNDSYDFEGESIYNIEGLESLHSVCTDEEELETVAALFSDIGYSGIDFSTDCALATASVEATALNTLTVYPNPVHDVIQIKSDNLISALSLYDLQGRILIYKTVNSESHSLEISQYPSGVYYLEIVSGDNKSVKKILKK